MNEAELMNRARQRADEADQREPRAASARYDAIQDALVIELRSGVSLSVPRRLLEGLATADPVAIEAVEVTPSGSGLHWEALDVDLSVVGIVDGIFGTKRWMTQLAKERGRVGGQSRSTVKVSASRQNGRKGGRPRKKEPVPA